MEGPVTALVDEKEFLKVDSKAVRSAGLLSCGMSIPRMSVQDVVGQASTTAENESESKSKVIVPESP